MVFMRGTLATKRAPSRGGQTGPAGFRRWGRLHFLEVFSLKEKLRELKERKRLFPVTTVRSGYRIDKIR